jgi:hypothetical protein
MNVATTFPDPHEDPLQRRKRIFNEVFASPVAQMELEEISKLIKQTAYDAECLREKEAAYRRLFADKVVLLDDDRLRQLREYVPIPPSVYKDDAQERRTRPSKDKDASQPQTIKQPRARSVSAEDKNLANIAKALGMDVEQARTWLASKKQQHVTPQPQPANGIPQSDEITQEDLDREAEQDSEASLPE